jgi:hypothetical protein
MGPHRVNIINVLQLIAAPTEQLRYQAKAPVNVAHELVNQWFDDFYHPTSPQFASEFSKQELETLAEFNRFFDERISLLPDSLAEMLKVEAWSEVVAKADTVLAVCGWQEVQARYEL